MTQTMPNRRAVADGDLLFREGDEADCAYIIESGRLEISTSADGSPVVICHLEAGDIVGEMGVIDHAPRTATARAVGETQLLVVTRDTLTDRLAGADPILKLLVKVLLDRYRTGLDSVRGDGSSAEREELLGAEVVGEYMAHGIDKMRLEAELKEALNEGQLNVFYQPLLDVQSERVAGFEALTRWEHPQRGHISPGLFISLAEETTLIVPVGLYVFEQACRDLVEFNEVAAEHGYPFSLFMSINVSARQIADADFIESAAAITDQHQVDRGQIKLELTEGLAMNHAETQDWIRSAQALGFRVSLDDFGTGYSSLETLASLPLNAAKIDQAFVRELRVDYRARELMRGIVSLMKGLGLQVIVEGIETRHQLNFIAALDCHIAQGYLIGPALKHDDARDLLIEGPALEDAS
ncbi:MAG: EAL domain-containing protein [Pseudomonadota bacterium]